MDAGPGEAITANISPGIHFATLTGFTPKQERQPASDDQAEVTRPHRDHDSMDYYFPPKKDAKEMHHCDDRENGYGNSRERFHSGYFKPDCEYANRRKKSTGRPKIACFLV
ncbi:MAG: hypothetical protein E6K63_14240 [Nitrospirae bacterium]|nr:MAG: hypothetical protein E6K63_14240 [Nitrospirota bacterium]